MDCVGIPPYAERLSVSFPTPSYPTHSPGPPPPHRQQPGPNEADQSQAPARRLRNRTQNPIQQGKRRRPVRRPLSEERKRLRRRRCLERVSLQPPGRETHVRVAHHLRLHRHRRRPRSPDRSETARIGPIHVPCLGRRPAEPLLLRRRPVKRKKVVIPYRQPAHGLIKGPVLKSAILCDEVPAVRAVRQPIGAPVARPPQRKIAALCSSYPQT